MAEDSPVVKPRERVLIPLITTLYPWQKQVVDICATAPTTTCHWYWGPIIGKTALARYLIENHHAYVVREPVASQIRAVVKKPECNIFVFHPAYANSKRIPYGEITNVMDGPVFFSKDKQVFRERIHAFVFSNHPPEKDKISDWKWHIEHITAPDQEPNPYPESVGSDADP